MLPPARWREFTALVETLDAGGEPLFPPDPALLPIARRVVRQLRDRRRRQAMPAAGETATVQLDSLRHEPTRSVGGERLALAALDELRFAAILRAAGLPERDARLACALVTARMLHPSSEREAQAWLAGRSAVLELLGLDDRPPPSDNKLHRLGDRLWALRDELERGLARSERALCAAAPAIVFYDLTNVHYHGRPRDDLQFGRAKQKRHDCPLVTLALALDELGFPRCSEVLPGNVSEPSTLKQVLTRLADRCGPQESRPLVIMDAGIATAANLAWLRKRGYDWITVTRGKREAPPARDPDCQFRSRCGLLVRAWKRAAPEPEGTGDAPCDATGPEMRICLWSEQRQQKDDAILAGKRQRFEQRLAALHAGLSRKNCTKRYDKVLERLGRLKQRYRLVSAQYDIVVERDGGGRSATQGAARREAAPGAGDRRALAAQRGRGGARRARRVVRAAHQPHRLALGARGAHVLAPDRGRGHLPQPQERTRPAPGVAPPRGPHPCPSVPRRAGVPRGASAAQAAGAHRAAP